MSEHDQMTFNPLDAQERRRNTDAYLEVLAAQFKAMDSKLNEMNEVLKSQSSLLTKLVLVEERQVHMSAAIERAFKETESIREDGKAVANRLQTLEQAAPTNQKTNKWVESAIGALLGALLTMVTTGALKLPH